MYGAWIFNASEMVLVSHLRELSLTATFCAVGKAQQLAHLKTANNKVNRPFRLFYGNLMGPFTPVAIGGYK